MDVRSVMKVEKVSTMARIKDFPERVAPNVKAPTALAGRKRPTMREWLESTARARPIRGKRSAAQIIRQLRDAR